MRKHTWLFGAAALLCALLLVGCDTPAPGGDSGGGGSGGGGGGGGSGGGGGGGGGGGTAALAISTTSLTGGTEGISYSAVIASTGGTGNHTWSFTGLLPAGLFLDTAATGASTTIAGIPAQNGVFNFTVSVQDATQSASQAFVLNIVAAGAGGFVITTTTLPGATVGAAFSQALTATGAAGPVTWSITQGGLSPGLTLSGDTISGNARVTGAYAIVVEATDGVNTDTQALTLVVNGVAGNPQLEQQLRQLVQGQQALNLPPAPPAALIDLGRQLFFDKALSGTQDVACATCHHPTEGYADSLNLAIGVGGAGSAATGEVGPGRAHPTKVFIPRNSPSVFYTGMMPELFWDKRVGRPPGQQQTQTPEGTSALQPVEAQALFPLVSIEEMRGTGHSLDGLSNADYRLALLNRLGNFPDYVNDFNTAFGAGGMTVDNMARAIGAFERSLAFNNSPWDRYLRGDATALTDAQKRGAQVFFGRGNCDNCHSGPLFTDFSTHNLGIPQFGPGKGNGTTGREDFGFENVTGNANQRFEFRTPPLRNVSLTAPYMHNGAFTTLAEVVNHYRDKANSTNAFTGANMLQAADLAPTLLPTGPVLQNVSNVFQQVPGNLNPGEINDLVAFMEALTDPAAINRTQDIPASVPSGLPVDRR